MSGMTFELDTPPHGRMMATMLAGIARNLGISKNTVADIVKRHRANQR